MQQRLVSVRQTRNVVVRPYQLDWRPWERRTGLQPSIAGVKRAPEPEQCETTQSASAKRHCSTDWRRGVLMLKGSLRSGRMGLYRSTGLQRRRHGKSSCHGSPRAQLPLRRLLVKLVACPLHRIRLGGRMRIGDTYCRREHPDLASKRWPKSGPGYKGAPPF